MDTQVVELLGRNQLMDELVRAGLEVALPVRDRGVDLIVYSDLASNTGSFVAVPIQLKASSSAVFTVNRKYERISNLILAFVWNVRTDDSPVTYGLTYQEAVSVAQEMGWTETKSWLEGGLYTTTRPSQRVRELLEPYRMTPDRWWEKLNTVDPKVGVGTGNPGPTVSAEPEGTHGV